MNTDKIYAEAIANEYAPKEASKVLALKKLDKKAKGVPMAVTLSIGVASSLVFGTGMSLAMGAIGGGTGGWYGTCGSIFRMVRAETAAIPMP